MKVDVHNTEQSLRTISVTIDNKALGLPANQLKMFDVLAGKEITPAKSNETGVISFSLKIPALTTVVLEGK